MIEFFILANAVTLFFSLPVLVFEYKKRGSIDLFFLYLFGVINLIFAIFTYCGVNYFIDIRKFNIVWWLFIVLIVEVWGVFLRLGGVEEKRNKIKRRVSIVNGWWFLLVFLVNAGCYYFLNSKYYDPLEERFFNPGYGINHDQLIVLGTAKAFFRLDKSDSPLVKLFYDHCRSIGYPYGGTYINVFFSQLNGNDVYINYQRIIVWLVLLMIFTVNYFFLNYFPRLNRFLRVGLLLVSVMSVMNYLSISFIDSSVLGSAVVTPFLFFSIVFAVIYLKDKNKTRWFWLVMTMVLIDVVFIYTYIAALFFALFIISAMLIYGLKDAVTRKIIIKLGVLLVLVFLIPMNLLQAKSLLKLQLSSSSKEYNVLSGAMYGNTIGFINPITAFSIWTSNADYRFYEANYHTTELFFTMLAPTLLFLIVLKNKKSNKKLSFCLLTPFMFMIGLTYWITRSSYQNSKTLHWFGDLWPTILLLLLYGGLNSKKLIIKSVTLLYIGVYFYISLRSAVFATTYIGKPIVSSSYELMEIEDEVCKEDIKTLFLGRDENSKYFLMTCKGMTFYYDRFDNNSAFWDIIHSNKLPNLTQECLPGSLKLTKIDYSGYGRVLIDKCFEFNNPLYGLEKEYKNYNLWKLIK